MNAAADCIEDLIREADAAHGEIAYLREPSAADDTIAELTRQLAAANARVAAAEVKVALRNIDSSLLKEGYDSQHCCLDTKDWDRIESALYQFIIDWQATEAQLAAAQELSTDAVRHWADKANEAWNRAEAAEAQLAAAVQALEVERERCARVAEEIRKHGPGMLTGSRSGIVHEGACIEIAAAIRALPPAAGGAVTPSSAA